MWAICACGCGFPRIISRHPRTAGFFFVSPSPKRYLLSFSDMQLKQVQRHEWLEPINVAYYVRKQPDAASYLEARLVCSCFEEKGDAVEKTVLS